VAASAELAQALLARVSGLTVLATSQEVLAVPIETVYRLDPLPVPPAEAAGAETIVRFGAVELFAARARTADRRFRLDDATAAGVAEICRALGGIPLALEMAAARVSLLGIEGVRGRLDDRLKLLVGRERIGAARHRTLRTMLEWSHGLLDPAEQRVFRRLAVFRGGFSLEAVIAVAGDNAAESWEVIDVLGKLIDKSLVAAEGGDAPRYRLLETLRFFAAEKLFASGEVDVVAERHARHVVVTLDRAYLVWEAGNDLEWLATNRPEIDNVRAALAWLSARPFLKDVFIDLVGTSARLFAVVGLFTEARLHAAKAESLIDDSIPPLAVARLLRQSGDLWANADRMRALTFLQRAADKYRQLEDYGSLAFVMAKLSSIHIFLNENEIAEEILLKAKSIAEKSIKNRSYVVVVGHLGLLYSSRQDYQMARSFYKESYDIADRCGIFQDKIAILANIAEVSWQLGDFDLSISQITEAIKVIRPIGNDLLLGRLLGNLSSYLILRDRIDEARIIEREAFHCIRGCGGYTTRISLQRCAVLAAASGDFHVAASVMGFVDAGFIKSGDARLATERKIGVRLVDILRQGLTSAEIDRHKVYGETWTEAKVLSLAETLLRLG
jgi:tetratricopeptide (TPR) repeat protein